MSKLPAKSIRIGDIDYALSLESNLEGTSGEPLFGTISFALSTIRIEPELSPQILYVTLWHEVIHALFQHAELNPSSDIVEQVVEMLSHGVSQVLKDNPTLRKQWK